MLSLRRAQLLHARLRAGLTCACAVPEVSPPEPGSVSEYHQHVLIKLPVSEELEQQAAEGQQGSWWGKFVEKDPAVLEVFKALAKSQQAVSSTVKLTAFDDVGSRQPLAEGACDLLAFPAGVQYQNLPLQSLKDVVVHIVADDPEELPPLPKEVQRLQEEVEEVVLLVCCHGARDARCGALGPPLAAKLLSLVRQRGLHDRIKVYKTSHVGGHKFAGNLLVYGAMHPCDGDWFGGLNADNAEEFLNSLVEVEIGLDGGVEDPTLRQWWRGRLGLSKAEQLELFEAGGGIEMVADLEEEDEEEEGGGLLSEEEGEGSEWEGLEEMGRGRAGSSRQRGR